MTAPRALLAWCALLAIAFTNGAFRELFLVRHLRPSLADQVSVATGCVLLFSAIVLLVRRWPLRSPAAARRTGLAWLVLTVSFEFAFGRLVGDRPWRELLSQYEIWNGRLWPLILLVIASTPVVTQSRYGSRLGEQVGRGSPA